MSIGILHMNFNEKFSIAETVYMLQSLKKELPG